VGPQIAPYLSSYVDRLRAGGVIRTPAVAAAFRSVARHSLVGTFQVWDPKTSRLMTVEHDPEDPTPRALEIIYSDEALVTKVLEGAPASSTSQPTLIAQMLELLELGPGMNVLEIGAGTGYNAALMAEIVGHPGLVVTIDLLEDVVEQARRRLSKNGYARIRVLHRDGFEGATEQAPFDRLVATGGCPDISPKWVDQIAQGGVMLIPLDHGGLHPLIRVWKSAHGLQGKVVWLVRLHANARRASGKGAMGQGLRQARGLRCGGRARSLV
jgi:protein-L-isoaspartate(D-aspartate) O-methyltransferase